MRIAEIQYMVTSYGYWSTIPKIIYLTWEYYTAQMIVKGIMKKSIIIQVVAYFISYKCPLNQE